ncbi:hypothetical protein WG902_13185 [Ramlibacter sp. PS3R-8]|uniref:hypothetical protein n=1 Tax=Ramlibacter sp. PS3R-8 TaxID=3133437 RepID=UPI003096B717
MTHRLRRQLARLAAITLLASPAWGAAEAPAMSKQAFKAAEAKIAAAARSERKACETHKGRAAELCAKEAKAREKIAKAELEADYEPSPDSVQEARNVKAHAEYDVAREKCNDLKGGTKDRCVNTAKSAREAAIRLAKVEKVDSMRAAEREAAAERKAGLDKAKP